jgi:hypothetical protein
MAFVHGKGTVIIIDSDDISVYTNTNEMTDDSDMHDTTCFGAVRKAYAAGLGDGQFVIGGVYDNTASGPRAVLKAIKAAGLPVTFQYRPDGTGATKAQTSVSVLVKQYVETAAVAAMTMWKCTLQMTGALDEAAQS